MAGTWEQIFVATRILLATEGGRLHRNELWDRVVELAPPDGDSSRRDARGRPPGFVSWSYSVADLAKAEWLLTIGGEWILTREGHKQLPAIQDSRELQEQASTAAEHYRRLAEQPSRLEAFPQNVIVPAKSDRLVREVGSAVLRRGLGGEPSVFDPSTSTWAPEVVGELYQAYNLQADTSDNTFMAKLGRQLEGLSDEGLVLAAELLTLHAVPLSNLKSDTKVDRLGKVLSWMERPVAIPLMIRAAFTQSSWNGGQGANNLIWRSLAESVELIRAWWQLPTGQRLSALDDPWAFRDFLKQQDAMPSLREAWQYLLYPTHFLPIVSIADKTQIKRTFADRVPEDTGDLHRDLFRITIALQNDVGAPVDYYLSPFEEQWRAEVGGGEQRAWLVRPSPACQGELRPAARSKSASAGRDSGC